jgi:hypothetical protein
MWLSSILVKWKIFAALALGIYVKIDNNFVLLEHLTAKIDNNYSEGRGDVKVRNMTPALYELLKIHQWAIYASILSGLHWKWIRQAPDKETVDRLYHIVLHSILEVEEKFSDFFFHLILNKSNYGSYGYRQDRSSGFSSTLVHQSR